MLTGQPFNVVRCIYTSSKIQLLNHSMASWCICQIYHLLVFRGLPYVDILLSTIGLGLYPHKPPPYQVTYTPPNHGLLRMVYTRDIS